MSRKPFLLVDPVEDAGGPHWLKRNTNKPKRKPGDKPKPPPKKAKGLDQIRREHWAKHRVIGMATRANDEDSFMQDCIEIMEDAGNDDAYEYCQILWNNGGDESDLLNRDFDESKHPRDEDGRWASGSGSDADDDIANSKSPASDLLAKNYPEEVPLETIKENLPAEFKAEEAKALAEMKDMKISSKEFTGPDGKYLPARAELHRQIVREMFTKKAIDAATPLPGDKPLLTLSGGRPAAGKTSSLAKELEHTLVTSFYISADEIQEKLPGYKGRLAGIYNGEAQDIALQVEKVARHMGLNIVYDATLKSKQPALERVLNYKEAGYEVDGYFVHTTPAISTKRVTERFMRDPDGKGRYIPPEISYNSRTNEATFDSLIPHLRNWALYDNNGKKPKRIAGSL